MSTSYSTQSGSKNTLWPSRSRAPRYFQKKVSLVCCTLLSIFLLSSCGEKTAVESVTSQEGQATLVYDTRSTENPEAYLDLDKGIVLDNLDADIALIVSGGTSLFNVIQPLNGTIAGSVGTQALSIDDCQSRIESLSAGNIPEVTPGNHLCVLTNQGRLALVKITKVTNPEPGVTSVQVGFMTEITP